MTDAQYTRWTRWMVYGCLAAGVVLIGELVYIGSTLW